MCKIFICLCYPLTNFYSGWFNDSNELQIISKTNDPIQEVQLNVYKPVSEVSSEIGLPLRLNDTTITEELLNDMYSKTPGLYGLIITNGTFNFWEIDFSRFAHLQKLDIIGCTINKCNYIAMPPSLVEFTMDFPENNGDSRIWLIFTNTPSLSSL